MKYEYKKVKGYEQKKFIENGHTMFEEDVLQRLKRLAYLEEQIKVKELNIPVVRQSFCPRCNHENEAHVVNKTVYWDCPNCGITGQTDF
jgi:transposase-like protein